VYFKTARKGATVYPSSTLPTSIPGAAFLRASLVRSGPARVTVSPGPLALRVVFDHPRAAGRVRKSTILWKRITRCSPSTRNRPCALIAACNPNWTESVNASTSAPTRSSNTVIALANSLRVPVYLRSTRISAHHEHQTRNYGKENGRRPTLPRSLPRSTIGAGGLNFSVRNGKRCIPAAIVTLSKKRQVYSVVRPAHRRWPLKTA
jgi:hypothetical protein